MLTQRDPDGSVEWVVLLSVVVDLGDEGAVLVDGGRGVHVAVVDGAGDADVGHAVGHEGVRVGRVPGALWRYGGK